VRLTVRVLGCEVLAIDTGTEPAAEEPEHTAAHRHSGEFALGFGGSSRPLPSDVEAREHATRGTTGRVPLMLAFVLSAARK
jgi:hypothetical protein